jgi:hypothetical protein
MGLDLNNNSRDGIAIGGAAQIDCVLSAPLAAGFKITISRDRAKITAFEPEVFFRWYLANFAGISLFAQGGIGVSCLQEPVNSRFIPLGGAAAGARILLKSFYFEPCLRFGYPFIWGAGLAVGYTILQKHKEPSE